MLPVDFGGFGVDHHGFQALPPLDAGQRHTGPVLDDQPLQWQIGWQRGQAIGEGLVPDAQAARSSAAERAQIGVLHPDQSQVDEQ